MEWPNTMEVQVWEEGANRLVHLEFVKASHEEAFYRSDDTKNPPIWVMAQMTYNGITTYRPVAYADSIETAEKNSCEECGSNKTVHTVVDTETLFGEDPPYGAEQWFEMEFTVCPDCGRVQRGKVELRRSSEEEEEATVPSKPTLKLV